MSSYQISHSRTRIAAARFIGKVRREILRSLAEEGRSRGLTQSDIAREIGVHRSVINRELRGFKDISVGRVAEFAAAMGRVPSFSMEKDLSQFEGNGPQFEKVSTGTETAARVGNWSVNQVATSFSSSISVGFVRK